MKQKKILRRYLRLKRNNFYERNDINLTDAWYQEAFVPKLETVLSDNQQFLNEAAEGNDNTIQISSYMPIKNEMNICPVMSNLLARSKFNYNHSLPVVVKRGLPLVFREYTVGDGLEKSHLFQCYEPLADKN